MQQYLFYWRRGWWAFLMMVCVNLGGMLLFFPLAFIFSQRPGAYFFSCLVAYLAVGLP